MFVKTPRRGMTPLGCLGVAVAMFSFVTIVAALSGYFFYQNFGPGLIAVRDQVQPLGERFIRLLDEEGYQAAYSMFADSARGTWNQEKFASLADDIKTKRGALQSVGVEAQRIVIAVTDAPKGQELRTVPIDFLCQYEKGEARFKFTFEKTGDVWKITELETVIEEPKRGRRPAPTPR